MHLEADTFASLGKSIGYMVRAADNQEIKSHMLVEAFINTDP